MHILVPCTKSFTTELLSGGFVPQQYIRHCMADSLNSTDVCIDIVYNLVSLDNVSGSLWDMPFW